MPAQIGPWEAFSPSTIYFVSSLRRRAAFIVTAIDAISCGRLTVFSSHVRGVQPSSEEDLVADLLQRSSFPCLISNRRSDLQASIVSPVNLNGSFLASLNLYDVLVSGQPRRRVLSSKSKRTGYTIRSSKLKLWTPDLRHGGLKQVPLRLRLVLHDV